MPNEFKGLMSPETEKLAGKKLKFRNAIAEIVDDPAIALIDNNLLEPLARKLSPEVREVVTLALAEVVAEMPEIEI